MTKILRNDRKIKDWLKINMPALAALVRILRSGIKDLVPYRLRKYNNYGFHNDGVLLRFVSEALRLFPISAFIETGTHKGDTASYMAKLKKDLPILTCEISDKFFKESRWRLRKFKNVRVFKGSSPDFLKKILEEKKFCGLPLFFLDAHADAYDWPLLDEIKIISTSFKKAIIIIDDFLVPQREDFGYDSWKGGDELKPYSMETIRPFLAPVGRYDVLYPNYEFRDAFPPVMRGRHDPLRGYVLLFQDAHGEFATMRTSTVIRDRYRVSNA